MPIRRSLSIGAAPFVTLGATLTAGPASAASPSSSHSRPSTRSASHVPVWDSPPPGYRPASSPNAPVPAPELLASAALTSEPLMSEPAPHRSRDGQQPGQPHALLGCTPDTGIDSPHLSWPDQAATGHGWWNKGNCSGRTAHITVRLYEWYANGSSSGWVLKATGRSTQQRPASSGGGWATARQYCASGARTTWLNVVDVDVNGEIDDSSVGTTKRDMACRVG